MNSRRLDSDLATNHAAQLVRGLRGTAIGDPVLLRSTVLEVLTTAGGPLFDGYHRSSDVIDSKHETVQIRPGDVDEPGVAELLAYAVGENSNQFEDIVQAYEDPAMGLLVATMNHEAVGVLGHRMTSAIEVLHIATALDRRRAGVGSRLLGALPHARGHGLPIVAETDKDAVGFYAANNFTITSLGDKYPGVERFHVFLRSSADKAAGDRAERDMGTGRSGWNNLRMAPKPEVWLRAATPHDAAFIVEMTRHACVIEDRPLPDPDDDEVREMLPLLESCRSLRRMKVVCPSVRCGRITAVHPCVVMRLGCRCRNCASVSPPDGVEPVSAADSSLRCSPISHQSSTQCAPTSTYATPPSVYTSAQVFAWSARETARSGSRW